jgi:hypothetical protein
MASMNLEEQWEELKVYVCEIFQIKKKNSSLLANRRSGKSDD